ncbi:MAG: hypothetical protein COB66_07875 [Coxiella sp. (in: Bacteria)]|nr:MAG: hypothetical protein COB66_07875 [Coxiella sp. (in: g-proteobacteria)]
MNKIQDTVSYLACPYAHDDVAVKKFRHALVNHYTNEFLKLGKFIYSPLTHNIPLHDPSVTQTWEIWQRFDTAMLSRCNELIVLQAEGWERSVGVSGEIEFAKSIELPIIFLEPDADVVATIATQSGLVTAPV